MENKHNTFKPFDKVLVRVGAANEWECDFYSHYVEGNGYPHKTLGWRIKDENILPYEGNEHLLGTSDEPEEEIKLEEGEWVMVCDFPEQFDAGWNVRQFKLIQEKRIYVTDRYECVYANYTYAIRFKDFNPNDMEETRKHILCVKNGKIIRYKK